MNFTQNLQSGDELHPPTTPAIPPQDGHVWPPPTGDLAFFRSGGNRPAGGDTPGVGGGPAGRPEGWESDAPFRAAAVVATVPPAGTAGRRKRTRGRRYSQPRSANRRVVGTPAPDAAVALADQPRRRSGRRRIRKRPAGQGTAAPVAICVPDRLVQRRRAHDPPSNARTGDRYGGPRSQPGSGSARPKNHWRLTPTLLPEIRPGDDDPLASPIGPLEDWEHNGESRCQRSTGWSRT